MALNNCLLSIVQYPVVLCGDFNLPCINWSLTFPTVSSPAANFMCDLVCDNYLHQMVVAPTRYQNLLDLVFTNQPDIVVGVQVVDNLPLTDHNAVQFILKVATLPQTPCKRSFLCTEYSSFHNVLFTAVISLDFQISKYASIYFNRDFIIFLINLYYNLNSRSLFKIHKHCLSLSSD